VITPMSHVWRRRAKVMTFPQSHRDPCGGTRRGGPGIRGVDDGRARCESLGRHTVAGKNAAAKILSVIQTSPKFMWEALNGPLTELRRRRTAANGIAMLETPEQQLNIPARLQRKEGEKTCQETFVASLGFIQKTIPCGLQGVRHRPRRALPGPPAVPMAALHAHPPVS